jgi:lipopolysaccharide/colanic/teichoic acid biosynthesis glycosyltransferase
MRDRYGMPTEGPMAPKVQLGVVGTGLSAPDRREKSLQLVMKRVIDCLIALFVLLVTCPLMIGIGIAIKLDSSGPIFIAQERIGRGGRPFRMYKFRSMVSDSAGTVEELRLAYGLSGLLFKLQNDPRRTRVGKALRRFSLDELPQLFNVLKGEMSLVGPRPPLPHEVMQYNEYQRHRLAGLPGMTGLWQVSGRSLLDFEMMVELDLEYLSNWSLWRDIVIMLRTIPAAISGKGAW